MVCALRGRNRVGMRKGHVPRDMHMGNAPAQRGDESRQKSRPLSIPSTRFHWT